MHDKWRYPLLDWLQTKWYSQITVLYKIRWTRAPHSLSTHALARTHSRKKKRKKRERPQKKRKNKICVSFVGEMDGMVWYVRQSCACTLFAVQIKTKRCDKFPNPNSLRLLFDCNIFVAIRFFVHVVYTHVSPAAVCTPYTYINRENILE